MIFHLKQIRIGGLVMKVVENVTIPPDVLEFRDAEGRVLGRITDVDIQRLPPLGPEKQP